jgi:hypothetical protein
VGEIIGFLIVHQLDCVSIIGSRVVKCGGRLPLVKSSFLQPGRIPKELGAYPGLWTEYCCVGSHLTHLELLGGRMSEDRGAISLWEAARHEFVEEDQST